MSTGWRRFVESPAYKYVGLVVCFAVPISIMASPNRERDLDWVSWSALLLFSALGVVYAIRDVRRTRGRG